MNKTYYCYNRSDNKLTNFTLINPNTKMVRNQFGMAEIEYLSPDMREEFVFRNGVLEATTKEEIDFLDHCVAQKSFKLLNGKMFDFWSGAVYLKTEQVKDEKTKTNTIIKTQDKFIIMEESAKLMSIDSFNQFFVKVGLPIPEEQKTKAELIEILKENGHIL